jgi:hypothetical protein
MAEVTVSDNEGKPVRDLRVTIAYARKRAPFRRFKLLSLDREVELATLTGLQAKILLALLFSPSPLCVKEIAALAGCTTSAACRALTGLAIQGLVVKVSRGLYNVKSDLAHFGSWNVQSIRHPQGQRETP